LGAIPRPRKPGTLPQRNRLLDRSPSHPTI